MRVNSVCVCKCVHVRMQFSKFSSKISKSKKVRWKIIGNNYKPNMEGENNINDSAKN